MMSCQQEALDATSNTVDASAFEILPTISHSEAQTKFAQILSKAVYNDEAVRSFIQKEALKQFDCDYDILYGKVKNQEVKEGITFKQALDVYAEDVNSLDQIEKSAPLINILFPNLESFGGMNAEKWDISDQYIGIVTDLGNPNNTVLSNGDSVSYIPSNEIPMFPLLIVKNSERMEVKTPATKSSQAIYSFKYDQFNPAYYNTKTKSRAWIEPTNMANKHWTTYGKYLYVEESEIDPRIIKAYNENDNNLCQREYIYYNLDKNHRSFNHDNLNNKIRERIYAMQITYNGLEYLSKSEVEPYDPSINGMTKTDIGSNDRIVVRKEKHRGQDLYKMLWDGSIYTFKFDIGKVKGDKVDIESKRIMPVNIREAFDISHVHIDRLTPNFGRRSREYYTVRPEWIKPKWIKFDILSRLQYWDPFTESKSVLINIFELDTGIEKEVTTTTTFTTTNKLDISGGASTTVGGASTATGTKPSVNLNLNAAYSHQYQKQISTQLKFTVTDSTDLVGSEHLKFEDEIILMDPKAKPKNLDGKKYYPIKHIPYGRIVKLAVFPMPTNYKPITKSGPPKSTSHSPSNTNQPKVILPPGFINPGSPIANPNNGMCSPNRRPMVLVAPGEEPPICKKDPSMYED
ncbi:hypothetical protein K5X82_09840 [Halosquirtibacter xylanolyticus]|uniref:hypothetical protein n=1 Tax=Halosquirtibacter xylanolyticus TaxID=3374599 RepID=UPI003748FEA5|nr:hypothetical protein K5X82_09840 [Prolixibacteraceae bacterium]